MPFTSSSSSTDLKPPRFLRMETTACARASPMPGRSCSSSTVAVFTLTTPFRVGSLPAASDFEPAATPAEAGNGTRRLPSLHLEELERLAIEAALDQTGWHQGRASEVLGVSPRTLHRKIRSYGLERPRG